MKKIISCLLAFTMIFCLASCGKSSESTRQDYGKTDAVTKTSAEENRNVESATEENSAEADSETATDSQEEKNILVAYFSVTNNTKAVAEKLADGLGADIYEITPEEPYTDADIDYGDDNSRTTIEMNDPDARPAIAGSVENMDQYQILFIGYPIWWGDAPRIISTFMESYDFSGKTIIPFCTSGGSGISSSAENLEKLTNGANWLEGKRLNGSDSQDTIMEWAESMEDAL